MNREGGTREGSKEGSPSLHLLPGGSKAPSPSLGGLSKRKGRAKGVIS